MMPSALRRSGPAFVRNGVVVTPMAQEHFCNGCGAECSFVYGDGRVCWCARRTDGSGLLREGAGSRPSLQNRAKIYRSYAGARRANSIAGSLKLSAATLRRNHLVVEVLVDRERIVWRPPNFFLQLRRHPEDQIGNRVTAQRLNRWLTHDPSGASCRP